MRREEAARLAPLLKTGRLLYESGDKVGSLTTFERLLELATHPTTTRLATQIVAEIKAEIKDERRRR